MVVSPLALFSYLQFLDLLSTLAFLSVGVQEANPLVNLALKSSDHPFGGSAVREGARARYRSVLLASWPVWGPGEGEHSVCCADCLESGFGARRRPSDFVRLVSMRA